MRKPDMIRKCKHCGKEYKRSAGQTKREFCSRECVFKHKNYGKQLTLNVSTKANRKSGKTAAAQISGFKWLFKRCQRCGWNEEPAILHAHHKDRNRKNNDISNIEILCPTCHVLEHFRAKDSIWK